MFVSSYKTQFIFIVTVLNCPMSSYVNLFIHSTNPYGIPTLCQAMLQTLGVQLGNNQRKTTAFMELNILVVVINKLNE